MTHTFEETKGRHFWHYVYRWYHVPRRTQQAIRWSVIVVFVAYTLLAIFFPVFYGRIGLSRTIHILLGAAVFLPFVQAAVASARLKRTSFRIAIDGDGQTIGITSAGVETVIDLDRVRSITVTNRFTRFTIKTESYDRYIYLFKSQTSEDGYARFLRDLEHFENTVHR